MTADAVEKKVLFREYSKMKVSHSHLFLWLACVKSFQCYVIVMNRMKNPWAKYNLKGKSRRQRNCWGVIYKLRTENLEGQRDGWLSGTRSVAVSGQSRDFFLDFTTDHFITLTNAEKERMRRSVVKLRIGTSSWDLAKPSLQCREGVK